MDSKKELWHALLEWGKKFESIEVVPRIIRGGLLIYALHADPKAWKRKFFKRKPRFKLVAIVPFSSYEDIIMIAPCYALVNFLKNEFSFYDQDRQLVIKKGV